VFPHKPIVIDHAHIVAARRLFARFQPQQWVNDNAVDSDPAVFVDVTEAYLQLTPEGRAAVRDNRESSDDLVLRSSDVWQRHGGPGYVEVEDFLEAFRAPEKLTTIPSAPCAAGGLPAAAAPRIHVPARP
jgi:hypothetical protein